MDVDEGDNDNIGDTIHFSFVVGDNFDSFSGSHASVYAVDNFEESASQIDPLLEAKGGKVLGVLVLHLSVENLVAFDDS